MCSITFSGVPSVHFRDVRHVALQTPVPEPERTPESKPNLYHEIMQGEVCRSKSGGLPGAPPLCHCLGKLRQQGSLQQRPLNIHSTCGTGLPLKCHYRDDKTSWLHRMPLHAPRYVHHDQAHHLV